MTEDNWADEAMKATGWPYRKTEVPDNIVGWMVFTDDPASAAMYNRSERDKAFSAARRWKASITALVKHPDAPDALARLAEIKP